MNFLKNLFRPKDKTGLVTGKHTDTVRLGFLSKGSIFITNEPIVTDLETKDFLVTDKWIVLSQTNLESTTQSCHNTRNGEVVVLSKDLLVKDITIPYYISHSLTTHSRPSVLPSQEQTLK